MFSISICMGATTWRLLFKTEESANKARSQLAPGAPTEVVHEITDDFGQYAVVRGSAICGVLFEDLDKSKLAAVELMLHDARTKNTAMKAAQSDPGLRAAAQGPSVIQPMTNGFRA